MARHIFSIVLTISILAAVLGFPIPAQGSPALTWTVSYASPVGTIKTLEVHNGKLYAGGFTGQAGAKLFAYDGASWVDLNFQAVAGETLQMIEALRSFNNRLYIGVRVRLGTTATYYSQVYYYDGSSFTRDFSTPGAGGCSGIEDLAVHDGALYAANGACGMGQVFVRNGDNDWSSVGAMLGEATRALASFKGGLYAGTGVSGNQARVWHWTGSAWELSLDIPVTFGMNQNGVSTLAATNDFLYAGTAGPGTATIIPAFDGAAWTNSSGATAPVYVTSVNNLAWAGLGSGRIYWNSPSWQDMGGMSYALDFADYQGYIYTGTSTGQVYRAESPNRYTISGKVSDQTGAALAGVTISAGGGLQAVSNSFGLYSFADLPYGSYTLTPTLANHGFTPASAVIQVGPSAVDVDFSGRFYDTGFRPNPDGYAFANPGGTAVTCDDFQRSFPGLSITCTGGRPQQALAATFRDYRRSYSSGICTGMATTSAAYFAGLEPRPQPGTTWALTYEQAKENILAYHGRQRSQAVVDAVLADWTAWTGEPVTTTVRVDAVYAQLKAALQPGNTDPVVLDFFPRPGCNGVGHTVTPYRLDESDPQHPKVYVYENFNPGSTTPVVNFDFSTSVHAFSYWMYNSNTCGSAVVLPVSLFRSDDGKTYSDRVGLTVSGGVEPVISGAGGGMIGMVGGQITATLPGAMPDFPWYQPGITATLSSYWLPADTYLANLDLGGGAYTVTVSSLDGSIELLGSGPSGGPADGQMIFDASLNNTRVMAPEDDAQVYQVYVTRRVTDTLMTYGIQNFQFSASGSLLMEALENGLQITSEGVDSGYQFTAARSITETLVEFGYNGLNIHAGDRQLISFDPGMGTATLQIDSGNNGTIDQIIPLVNQGWHIYIPRVSR